MYSFFFFADPRGWHVQKQIPILLIALLPICSFRDQQSLVLGSAQVNSSAPPPSNVSFQNLRKNTLNLLTCTWKPRIALDEHFLIANLWICWKLQRDGAASCYVKVRCIRKRSYYFLVFCNIIESFCHLSWTSLITVGELSPPRSKLIRSSSATRMLILAWPCISMMVFDKILCSFGLQNILNPWWLVWNRK